MGVVPSWELRVTRQSQGVGGHCDPVYTFQWEKS